MAGKNVLTALNLHRKGFNCAQSVALPFCDELGVDKETVLKGLEGFGAGMGDMNHTCGALSGAVFVAGLCSSCSSCKDGAVGKKDTYALCREITAAFVKECGSDNCRILKGLDTSCPLKSCDECVAAAAKIAERVVANKK